MSTAQAQQQQQQQQQQLAGHRLGTSAQQVSAQQRMDLPPTQLDTPTQFVVTIVFLLPSMVVMSVVWCVAAFIYMILNRAMWADAETMQILLSSDGFNILLACSGASMLLLLVAAAMAFNARDPYARLDNSQQQNLLRAQESLDAPQGAATMTLDRCMNTAVGLAILAATQAALGGGARAPAHHY